MRPQAVAHPGRSFLPSTPPSGGEVAVAGDGTGWLEILGVLDFLEEAWFGKKDFLSCACVRKLLFTAMPPGSVGIAFGTAIDSHWLSSPTPAGRSSRFVHRSRFPKVRDFRFCSPLNFAAAHCPSERYRQPLAVFILSKSHRLFFSHSEWRGRRQAVT